MLFGRYILREGEGDGGSGGAGAGGAAGDGDGKPAGGTPSADAGGQQQLPGTPTAAEAALTTANAEITALKADLAKHATDQSKSDEKALEEAGKHQELATKRETERDAAFAKLDQERMTNALLAAGQTAGLRETRYLAMIDRSEMSVVDGKVVGADKAIEALKTADASLFGEPKQHNSKTPDGAPAGDNGGGTFDPSKEYTPDQIVKMDEKAFKAYSAHINGNRSQHSI